MPEFTGTVTSVLFENEKKSYSVFKLNAAGEVITATARSLAPMVGEHIILTGEWNRHPRFGKQLAASAWRPDNRLLNDNTVLFLQHKVSGIGEKLALRIAAAFGDDLFDVISNRPEELASVRGVSAAKAAEAGLLFAEYNDIRDIKTFLEGFSVSGGYAPRIVSLYGSVAKEIILDNPYRLCEDFDEIGFEVADCIAVKKGIEKESRIRMRSGLNYSLLEAMRDGHCCLPRSLVVRAACRWLGLPGAVVDDEIADMHKDGELVLDWEDEIEFAFLPYIYNTEQKTAMLLHEINLSAEKFSSDEVSTLIDILEKKSHIQLADEQRAAIISVLNEGVTIITGGPGTGKTTIIRCIRELFEHCGLEVALAAPTGRAARRLSEAAGSQACTVHRLLEAQGKDAGEMFLKNADNQLTGDVFVIDEASMLDVLLLGNLLEAIPYGSRLVLVGDSDQLPSVGPGMVLRDVLKSEALPVVKLTRVYRQEAGSAIIDNSCRIKCGMMPRPNDDEFIFVEADGAADVAERIVSYCAEAVLHGADKVNGMQVLAPMYRADCGVYRLNNLLQQKLNPAGDKVVFGHEQTMFRVGDKVMQTRNNYEKGVYNGDVGIVVNFADNGMIVDFYGNMIHVEPENVKDIQLAYAVTVHKSQGSEYPLVVMVLSREHAPLLGRKVLYTAVTRAKNKFIAFGSISALRRAVVNEVTGRRWTALEAKIRRAGSLV